MTSRSDLEAELSALKQQNERLREALEEAQRARAKLFDNLTLVVTQRNRLRDSLKGALELFEHAKFDNGVTSPDGKHEAEYWSDLWRAMARAALAADQEDGKK